MLPALPVFRADARLAGVAASCRDALAAAESHGGTS